MEANAHTILLVEDDTGLCELLSDIISDCGYKPHSIQTGTYALEWLKHHTPSLMVLDYGLPDMTCKELISKLLAQNNFVPPFIVSTGQGDERVAVGMMKMGARDYIVKDTNFLELIPLVINKVSKEIQNEKKIQKTENELLELSQFNNQIVSNVHEGIVVFDMNMNYKVWNPFMENLFGISASEILDKKLQDCFPFLENAGIISNIEEALLGNYPPTVDYSFFVNASGKSGWASSTSVPLLNSTGRIIGAINSVTDITHRKKTELAIRENEEYISSILSCIPDLLFVFNSDGVYLDFKSGNLSDLLTTENEFIGKNLLDVLPENVAKSIQSGITKVLKNEIVEPFEYVLDIGGKAINFECHLLLFGNNKVLALVRNITERKKAEIALGNSQEQLKKFAAHLQDIREEERIMLAREIHDELGQILVALKIDMGMLKQKTIKFIEPENTNDVLKNFNQILNLIDSSLKTTRRIMTGLRPEVLEIIGFIEAVKLYTQEFQQRHNINCLFENSLTSIEVNSQQAVALYRILQEALTNIVKHAKATTVKVQLGINESRFFMEITDNGIGLDTTHKAKMDSFGLIGMRERVYLLDGDFDITSQPGKGTCIRIEMPYSK